MKSMVVGLGNPGRKYNNTRHNVGYIVVDALVNELGGSWKVQRKFKADMAEVGDIIFVKPRTYMNLSGVAVAKALSFFKISPERLIVIHDDADIIEGTAKYVQGGGAAGHKGVSDIIEKLGTTAFKRVRVGISRPEKSTYDLEDWVLGSLSDAELSNVLDLVPEIAQSINNP